MLTCRYCSLFCPSVKTPTWGHCAGVFPPLKVKAITDACPYHGDATEISKVATARGFSNHNLKAVQYFGVSELGLRTRLYSDLEKLREDVKASGLDHTLYVLFIDSDNSVFYRAVISGDKGGSP